MLTAAIGHWCQRADAKGSDTLLSRSPSKCRKDEVVFLLVGDRNDIQSVKHCTSYLFRGHRPTSGLPGRIAVKTCMCWSLLCNITFHSGNTLDETGVACRSEVWRLCCCDEYTHRVLRNFGRSFLQSHKLSSKKEQSWAYRASQMRHFGKRSVSVVQNLHAIY